MAIITGFSRETRAEEIAGCPLVPKPDGRDESSCVKCPYNVLSPGHPRMGCVLSTPAATYDRCMSHLESVSSNDCNELRAILKAERKTGRTTGLDPTQVERVRTIAERWWPLVGNDKTEQQVVTAMMRFCDASRARREPIRILA